MLITVDLGLEEGQKKKALYNVIDVKIKTRLHEAKAVIILEQKICGVISSFAYFLVLNTNS